MPSQNQTYDISLLLKDAGLVDASAAATVGGQARVIDLGAAAEIDAELIVDVSALEIDSNDESYDIVLQGSPDADFGTAANIAELLALHLGAKETKRTDADADDTTGRYIMRVTNERNGTVYRYLRVYTVVAGTVASGINYTARLATF
jgi:hypothetical protein